MKSTRISTSFEKIGPCQAEKILMNVHPRQTGRNYAGVIKSYADQMRSGLWDEDVTQSISITDDGMLVDGWHRLHAVKMSGATITFLVVRGVSAESFAKYDAGKSRSIAFRAGVSQDDAATAGMLIRICRYNQRTMAQRVEDVNVALQFIAKELELFKVLVPSINKRRTTSAPVRAACILRMKMHPASASEICDSYIAMRNGDLTQTHTLICCLYRRLMETRNEPLMVFILSYMAFDPGRWGNDRLQVKSPSNTIAEVCSGVLAPLVRHIQSI